MAEKVFDTLFAVNVNEHTEKKKTGNVELTYLSWAYAWAEVKKRYPYASYEIEKFNGLPYVYDPMTGYMVYTTVTIEGVTHEMWLPVMDGANKAMKSEPYKYYVKDGAFRYCKKATDGKFYDKYGSEHTEYIEKECEAATMFDINKTIMRCLVKNLAMFGLGLYIYAGEDLPEGEQEEPKEQPKPDRMAKYKTPTINQDEAAELEKALVSANVNIEALCKQMKVKKLIDLSPEQMMSIYGKLPA